MESAENSLSTLRRTSFALVGSAIAILVLMAPSGRNFGDGLEELAWLREVLREYEGYCATVASKAYDRIGEDIRSRNAGSENPFALSPSFGVVGFVQCNLPGRDDPLETHARFFLERREVLVAAASASEIYEELARRAPTGTDAPALDSVFLLIHPSRIPDASLQTVVYEGESLRMQFVDSSAVVSADSLSAIARFHGRAGTSSFNWRTLLTGVAFYWEYQRPLDWLRATGWREGGEETGAGELIPFPRLRPFWEEIRTLSPSDAARRLQDRADEQRGNVEILGLEISTGLLAWGGPLVVLAIILYFFAQLRHLEKISRKAGPVPLVDYPWIALFDDRLSVSLAFVSIALLPVLANMTLAVRLLSTTVVGALWAATVAVVCGVIGVRAWLRLGDLRRLIASSS